MTERMTEPATVPVSPLSVAEINAALDKSMSYALLVRRLADTVAAGGSAAAALDTCTDLPHPDVRAAAAHARTRVQEGAPLSVALRHPHIPRTLPLFIASGEDKGRVGDHLTRAAAILSNSAEETLSDAMDLLATIETAAETTAATAAVETADQDRA